ncbi:MAG TPA: hypothetical protein VJR47_15735 [Stellaceae bacterium]|nr:hypothetical protein [Stellaceae bacterium]
MPSLSHRRPAPPAPIASGQDLAHDLLRAAARLRRAAQSSDADEVRDALVGLAGQCDRAAAIVLRDRRGRSAGSQIAPAA